MSPVSVQTIRILDTLTGKKVAFALREEGSKKVRIYCCGPTVWGHTHIGNARAALTLDLITRIFHLAGYKTETARNYTDVDDKIIAVSEREKISAEEVAKKYTRAYDDDLKALGAQAPDHTPRATSHIPQMIKMISGLMKNGLAYEAKSADGKDVYFRVESFPNYGSLSKRKIEDMTAGVRIDPNEAKENPADFALWKAAKKGEPSWESPWGKGRPGWHIECSAMIDKIFDSALDIHMGGLDLIFPHHENEIAQSEGLSGKKLANFWVHNGMIELEHEKMSKSLGNLILTRDFLEDYGTETFRLLVFQQHYRSPMDISSESILRAEALVDRLYTCKKLAVASAEVTNSEALPEELKGLKENIQNALFDDFNSAKALGLILGAARLCFKDNRPEYWKAWRECLPILENVFGILCENPAEALQARRKQKLKRVNVSEEKSREIEDKLREREHLRLRRDFQASDRIRAELEGEGILVMDGPDGATWTVKSSVKETTQI